MLFIDNYLSKVTVCLNKIPMATEPKNATVLIIDDDAEIRYSLHRVLSTRNYEVLNAADGEEGINLVKQRKPQVVFLDNRMEGMSGLETLQHLRSVSPSTMVILMTAFGTTQTAIEAMKYGAFDYIIKPFDSQKVFDLANKAVNANKDLNKAGKEYTPLLDSEDYQEGIVGSSELMQEVFKIIGQVAATDVTVMITGESGTGKELVARCLWQHSHRSGNVFLPVNCAAIPENLIESELFGHEKGSFTGATRKHIGKFERCDGGTIFLDEIGDMALPTQTKILRAIQEGEIQRVGGNRTIKVDVRLVAATNKDVEKMVADRIFREDLYYRLNVVRIKLPPLRQRDGDIPQLADYILQRLNKAGKTVLKRVSEEGLEALKRYGWPGNVRELENIIHRSTVVAQGDTILLKDLPQEVQDCVVLQPASKPETTTAQPLVSGGEETKDQSADSGCGVTSTSSSPTSHADQEEKQWPDIGLDDAYDILYERIRKKSEKAILHSMEREMIRRALKETGGNQVKTSAILGITRSTLRKRIEQFSLKY